MAWKRSSSSRIGRVTMSRLTKSVIPLTTSSVKRAARTVLIVLDLMGADTTSVGRRTPRVQLNAGTSEWIGARKTTRSSPCHVSLRRLFSFPPNTAPRSANPEVSLNFSSRS